MIEEIYTPVVYDSMSSYIFQTAEFVVPYLREIIPLSSVIDVGCGDGTWLKAFQAYGVKRLLGLDGSHALKSLKIDSQNFIACDLNTPPEVNERFDLALSLEVAEHLLESSAENFVKFLTSVSDHVLFSAAIPYQTAADHINMQWQSYWADLFYRHYFLPITTLRSLIWNEPSIPYFYKQNIVLYVHAECVKQSPLLSAQVELSKNIPMSVVHPDFYLYCQQERAKTYRDKLGLYIQGQIGRFKSLCFPRHP